MRDVGRTDSTDKNSVPRVQVGGILVDRLNEEQWCRLMLEDWEKKYASEAPAKVVTTANGQVISLSSEDTLFRDSLSKVDHVAADGMSVVFASRLTTDAPLPERVATTDWFHAAARVASRHGIRFYFLGATAEMNRLAVERVRTLYPYLQIAGSRDGYFDRNNIEEVAAEIAETDPDILWIGVGNPEQVMLAHKFKELVPGLTWVRTCGGLFDFLSGQRLRAPGIMQSIGMEWLFRMMLEPKRLGMRYVTTNFKAIKAMLQQSGEVKAGPVADAGLEVWRHDMSGRTVRPDH